jgi:hypothetical protein
MADAVAVPAAAGHFTVQPFRPSFLTAPGQPSIPWQRWIDQFEDWLLAVGFPDVAANAQRKAALLRSSLGTEGYRIYSSLAVNTREPYEDARARLQAHFGQPPSTIFARAQFTRFQQKPGMSVLYIVQLV